MRLLPALAIASLLVSSSGYCLSDFSAANLSGMTDGLVHELIQTVSVGTDHRAYMPASSLSWAIGLDVGVEATAVRLSQNFKSTLSTVSGQDLSAVPGYLPVPRLNLHKGLPFGLEVGMSYIGYSDKLKVIGGDVKWSFLDGVKVSPVSAALRLSLTSEKLWYIRGTTWQPDLLISKRLFIIEPYLGSGLQFWSGHLDIPTNLPASSGLPASVSGSGSGTNAHFFMGIPLQLSAFWITAETDYSTAGIFSFGSKFSLNF